ncbi:creatininase family protein [Phytoactinopolyspora alkaliphila]|uniref:Creatininase family protein n=2 Tax=Phytoactinopolyspora alkaliphila TaxID=1783498 RepID=A0A6N9YMT7_9ACTN|nr:creatininase family protein [Phytoactinopolyspora alkaliphila]NED96282.1 creatininase family protein [Phytoactinopolyspora alkaliphila]
MSWPEVETALKQGRRTVVFACGSIEQHGPHLPLVTDTLFGDVLSARVAERMRGVLTGPTLPLGVSPHHMSFPGTITLSAPTFTKVVAEYIESLASHGFENVLVIPSHGGNFGPLGDLLHQTGGRIGTARFIPYTGLQAFIKAMTEVGNRDGVSSAVSGSHAGEAETSIMLAMRPDLVDLAAAVPGYLGHFDDETADRLFEGGTAALSEMGVLGDPRPADAERGVRYLRSLTDLLVTHFETEIQR